MANLDGVIGARQAAEIDMARVEYETAGVAPEVARLIASLPQLLAACDIVRTAPAAAARPRSWMRRGSTSRWTGPWTCPGSRPASGQHRAAAAGTAWR